MEPEDHLRTGHSGEPYSEREEYRPEITGLSMNRIIPRNDKEALNWFSRPEYLQWWYL